MVDFDNAADEDSSNSVLLKSLNRSNKMYKVILLHLFCSVVVEKFRAIPKRTLAAGSS